MAYRILNLMLLVVILLTLPFLQTAYTTPQNRMSCIRDIVTIVGGGGIVGVGATLWKLVSDYRCREDKDHVYSDVPRMPSSHLFQPRAEEIRELEEKFNTLEKTNPGDLVVAVYIKVVRLSWLDSLGENSSPGTSTRIRSYLLGH